MEHAHIGLFSRGLQFLKEGLLGRGTPHKRIDEYLGDYILICNSNLNILYSTNNSSSNSHSTIIIKNVVKVNTTLNVRNKPNGTVIGKLKNGDEVKISNYQNGWFEIGKDRWVSADYVHSTYGIVTANTLNIRSGAGTNYQDIGDLKKNENVRVLKESNGWYLVLCGTRYGWASAKYIQLI